MLLSSIANPPSTVDELLGPQLMASLDRIDVFSRKVFAGKMPGERRSKRRGQSVEFDDYREYTPGDDLRHIDWNVFARFDRFVIKLFREDEDLSVRIVLDASPSMHAGDPSKLLAAHRLAMAIGYVGLVNQNRVSVSVLGAGGVTGLAPMRGKRSVQRLGAFLLESLSGESQPGSSGNQSASTESVGHLESGSFNAALTQIAADRLAGKGMVFLLSDMLVREGWTRGLDALSAVRGYDTACLQILSPDELDPAGAVEQGFVGDLRLTDAETGRGAEVTVSPAMLRQYQTRLTGFLESVKKDCRGRGITHNLVPSNADLGQLITGPLRRQGLFA
ncbi:MAG: hypothetical protein ACI89L_001897 [Phycisphaerales bacterium]